MASALLGVRMVGLGLWGAGPGDSEPVRRGGGGDSPLCRASQGPRKEGLGLGPPIVRAAQGLITWPEE